MERHVADINKPGAAGISRTCIYVAAGRAIGAREPDPSVRNPDRLAEQLLGDASAFDVDHPVVRALRLPYEEAMSDVEVASNVRMMIIRTRFIDEALERAVAAGIAQIVILGAGFDSHAYRCRDLLKDVKLFEVDRPVTQALKKERVSDVIGEPPSNLTYVPIDFQHEELLEVLVRHDFDPQQRTFFVLEGVTMYLPEEAVRKTFAFVASQPPGSGIVFDFVYRGMIDMIAAIDLANTPAPARAFVERFLKLTRDEPWIFGLPYKGEGEFLGGLGLELRESLMVGGEESNQRYLTKSDGTQVGGQAMAQAMARRAEYARAAGSTEPDPQMLERLREQQRLMAYQIAEAMVPAHA